MENNKVITVIIIQLIIAMFFIIGAEGTSKQMNLLFHSYFADLFLPFGFYFLLTINSDKQIFNTWWKRAFSVFILCTTSEILQYFGVYALAQVFDPLDILMYEAGVISAAFVDRKVLSSLFNFWS